MAEALPENPDRRPLASRRIPIFQWMAARLAAAGVAPNAISVSSMIFGVGAGAALAATSWSDATWLRIWWVLGAALIQLRLLANMLDGMVAVDSNRKSPVGDLYNEVPDRVSDPAILIGAGYALGGSPILGFVAAIVALFVAYVRAIGASAGAGQAFHGPMAKPQRMFLLTVASIYCALTPHAWQPMDDERGWGLVAAALALIIVGGLVTTLRRLLHIARAIRGCAS